MTTPTREELAAKFDATGGYFDGGSLKANRSSAIDALFTQVREEAAETWGLDLANPEVAELALRVLHAVGELGAASFGRLPEPAQTARMLALVARPGGVAGAQALQEGIEILSRAAARSFDAPDLSGFEAVEIPDDLKHWLSEPGT